MSNVRAVLFDLDETLIDAPLGLSITHRAIAKRLREHIAQHISADEQTLRSKIKALDDRMNLETKYDRDGWWPILLRDLGITEPPSRVFIKELTRLYWKIFIAASRPYPDAEQTLEYLRAKGYKLALVTDTNGVRGMKRRRAERLRLARFFDTIVIGGEDTLYTKPSPEPLLLAASKLGVQPSECVFVGDKPFTDIKAARAAGMRTIRIKRRDWGVEERTDAIVSSLAELRDLL